MINVTNKEWQKIVSQYYNGEIDLTLDELMEKYNIILEHIPQHKNESINNLINTVCTESEQKENKIVYKGYAYNYRNFDRYLTNDFKPMYDAFNGYREVYYSIVDLCSVTTVEHDVIITLFDSMEALEKNYNEAESFYLEY